jgi:hypothetical protein
MLLHGIMLDHFDPVTCKGKVMFWRKRTGGDEEIVYIPKLVGEHGPVRVTLLDAPFKRSQRTNRLVQRKGSFLINRRTCATVPIWDEQHNHSIYQMTNCVR